MSKYLGQEIVPIHDTPYADYTPFDWAMYFIESYGQIDGEKHKAWVLDQVARLHNGIQPIIKKATWSNGYYEYRIKLGEVTESYLDWVQTMEAPQGSNVIYEYDCGKAP